MNENNRILNFSSIFTFAFVIAPILSAYSIWGLFDLGTLLVIISSIPVILYRGRLNLSSPKYYFWFVIIAILIALLINGTLPQRLLLYTVSLVLGCSLIDYKKALKYYHILVIVSCTFFLLQEFMFALVGYRVSGIFNFLPTIYGDMSADIINGSRFSDRSSSFFLEPSFFVQYLFPYVALNLFDKKGLYRAIGVSLIILLSKSGNGVLLLILMWSIWFLFSSNIKGKNKLIVVFLTICFLSGVMYFKSDIFDSLIARTSELSISGKNDAFLSSGFMRIYRGYFLFSELTLPEKFLGASPALVSTLIENNRMFYTGDTFLNGVQQILLYHGYLGLCLYVMHLFALSRPSTFSKVIITCIFLLLLTEAYFLSPRMLLVVVLLYKYNITN